MKVVMNVLMVFLFVPLLLAGLLLYELSARDVVGEYFCYKHDGLATIDTTTYRDFVCVDGSAWHIEVNPVRPAWGM